jgi:hypothetical protein
MMPGGGFSCMSKFHRLIIAAIYVILAGCAAAPASQSTSTDLQKSQLNQALREQIQELDTELGSVKGQLAVVRESAAANELRRIDAETRLARLQKRYEELERAHDDAVSEVVRAQAKLRGSVGQADAASDIAEAQIAINNAELGQELLSQARIQLEKASIEFDLGNYGGALYLSSQVKRLIADAHSLASTQVQCDPVGDEIPFESPLALMLSDNSNVRDGPGLKNEIIVTLPKGTHVDGHSHSGAWVRVQMEDGTNGWIYQTLVTARDETEETPDDQGTTE